MILSEFKHLIAAYGADMNKWPADLKKMAERFRLTHPEETDLLMQEAALLDMALDKIETVPPSDLVQARILRALPSQEDIAPRKSVPALGWRSIAAMVVAAFGLGFGGAQYLALPVSTESEPVFIASVDQTDWLEAAEDLGFSDVYYWVQGEEPVITVSDI